MFLYVLFLFVQFFSAKVKIRAKYLNCTRQLAKKGLPHTAVLVLDEHFVQYSFAPEDPTIDACTTATWTTWFQGSEPNGQRWWTAQLAAVDHDEHHQHHQRHQRDRHDLRCLADLGRSWQLWLSLGTAGKLRQRPMLDVTFSIWTERWERNHEIVDVKRCGNRKNQRADLKVRLLSMVWLTALSNRGIIPAGRPYVVVSDLGGFWLGHLAMSPNSWG